MESEDYASIEKLDTPKLWKSQIEHRPVSSDSDSSGSGKKRAFSEIITSPPKFRMSRKRPRQTPPENTTPAIQVFDAIREAQVSSSTLIPPIRSSGVPDEIQRDTTTRDAALQDILRSYLTVDADNRVFVNLKDEYVYDIYYRMAVSPVTVPTDANFGVLVYESEAEMVEDEDEVHDEDDADSNSEGYYQNSYPDEGEWAGEGWGSDEDNDYGRPKKRIGFDSDEDIVSDSGDDVCSYSETE